jgi:hypothetical protein
MYLIGNFLDAFSCTGLEGGGTGQALTTLPPPSRPLSGGDFLYLSLTLLVALAPGARLYVVRPLPLWCGWGGSGFLDLAEYRRESGLEVEISPQVLLAYNVSLFFLLVFVPLLLYYISHTGTFFLLTACILEDRVLIFGFRQIIYLHVPRGTEMDFNH